MSQGTDKAKFWDRMAQAHPTRSLLLFAAGTAFGLAVAAYGLFSVPGTRIAGVPPEDVALVNGRHILRTDFIAQVQLENSIPYEQSTPEQRRKVLDEMVNEELLVQRGLEVDLAASDPDVRAYMVAGVQLQVDADVIAQRPSEEDLDKYFQANKDKYTGDGIMALRDFIVARSEGDTKEKLIEKAKTAAEAFAKGRGADDLAATYGLADSGKIERGDLFDFAVKIKLSPPLFEAANKLTARQASQPIEEADGNIHILMMEKRQTSQVTVLEDARDAVLQDFKRELQTKVEDGNLAYLRSRADIQLAPDFAQ
jgi:parvulin-like peptidyl-prolyl isomerase